MEWISIKDRLPEDDNNRLKRILAYGTPTCCGNCEAIPQIQFCVYNRSKQEEGFTYGEYSCGLDATHWMPLPDFPKD